MAVIRTYRQYKNCEDDDDDDVIAEQAAAAAQQVLQRASTVATGVDSQEHAGRLRCGTRRAQGGRDTGTAVRQLSDGDQRTLRRTPGLSVTAFDANSA